MSLFWLPSHSSISYSLLILNQSSKKDPTGDSDASDDSDEEKVGMVKNSQGMNVNANISAAAITRGERGSVAGTVKLLRFMMLEGASTVNFHKF